MFHQGGTTRRKRTKPQRKRRGQEEKTDRGHETPPPTTTLTLLHLAYFTPVQFNLNESNVLSFITLIPKLFEGKRQHHPRGEGCRDVHQCVLSWSARG